MRKPNATRYEYEFINGDKITYTESDLEAKLCLVGFPERRDLFFKQHNVDDRLLKHSPPTKRRIAL